MYILYKRYGRKRNFKRYNSLEELYTEINKGHNERFQGNNQFYYNTETKEITILNNRLSIYNCQEYLEFSNVVPAEEFSYSE
ncbi:MAG TPA: hypothetical protein VGB63_11075 [Pedobacter sp.]|jgi:hypothetical protein